jgi:hypothetical protein
MERELNDLARAPLRHCTSPWDSGLWPDSISRQFQTLAATIQSGLTESDKTEYAQAAIIEARDERVPTDDHFARGKARRLLLDRMRNLKYGMLITREFGDSALCMDVPELAARVDSDGLVGAHVLTPFHPPSFRFGGHVVHISSVAPYEL